MLTRIPQSADFTVHLKKVIALITALSKAWYLYLTKSSNEHLSSFLQVCSAQSRYHILHFLS